jgi:hypothetical protein
MLLNMALVIFKSIEQLYDSLFFGCDQEQSKVPTKITYGQSQNNL